LRRALQNLPLLQLAKLSQTISLNPFMVPGI
jgi:hypothetical protein